MRRLHALLFLLLACVAFDGRVNAEGFQEDPMTTVPVVACPTGYRLDGKACSGFILQSKKPWCPEDFVLEGEYCVRNITYPAKMHCPSQYQENKDGFCEFKQEYMPQQQCPTGYRLVNAGAAGEYSEAKKDGPALQCQRETYLPFEKECPKGFAEMAPAEEQHPEDKKREPRHTKGGLVCGRRDASPPNVSCPKGMELDAKSNVCHSETIVPPNVSCPKGYEQAGDICIANESIPPTSTCPKDFAPDVVVQRPNMLKGKFEKEKEIHASHACVRHLSKSPVKTCPEANQEVDTATGLCSSDEVRTPEVVCPSGMGQTVTDDGVRCVGEKMPAMRKSEKGDYEQFETEPGYACPRGFVMYFEAAVSGQGGKTGLDRICRKDAKGGQVPILTCPEPGYELEGHMCYLRESRDPALSCPMGYDLIGEKCTRQRTIDAYTDCPKGSTAAPSKAVEPAAYKGKKEATKQCVEKKTQAPRYSCEADAVMEGNKCVTITTVEYDYYCPKGTEKSASGCMKVTVVPSTYGCQRGGKLVWKVGDTPRCALEDKAEMVGECEGEGVFNGHECLVVVKAKAQLMCSKGFVERGEQCAAPDTVAPKYKCRSVDTIFDPTTKRCEPVTRAAYVEPPLTVKYSIPSYSAPSKARR